MHHHRRVFARTLSWAVPVLLFLQGGCGDEVTGPPPDGNGGPNDHGPFEIFDIALRPQSIQRASSLAGSLPNPHIAFYNLSAFYAGGAPGATFMWDVNPVLGSLEPKTTELGREAATVVLRNDGRTPLGVYEIAVNGTSGTETSRFSKRFAVVEHNWMKHQRATITNPNDPPASLVLNPVYAPLPGGGDEIYFVAFPNPAAVDVWRITADAPYTGGAQNPEKTFFLTRPCINPLPEPCPPNGVDPAPKTPPQDLAPDLSPAALGRDEILFSSQMDVLFRERANTLNARTPFSLWVVRRPTSLNPNFARVITFDVPYQCIGGQICYRAWDYRYPRWDPSPVAPQAAARIGFIASIADTVSIFLGDLLDRDMDARSDTLDNIRRLPNTVGVSSFDWHPNGQSIYFTSGAKGIHKLDVASGTVVWSRTFTHLDSLITNFAWVSVSKAPGAQTLLAFQAVSENRVHLYAYEEETDTLMRLNPFGFPVNLNLYPRWHPTRQEIVYVSDYNVGLWLGSNDPTPVGNPAPLGQLRTLYPSVWTARLQERTTP